MFSFKSPSRPFVVLSVLRVTWLCAASGLIAPSVAPCHVALAQNKTGNVTDKVVAKKRLTKRVSKLQLPASKRRVRQKRTRVAQRNRVQQSTRLVTWSSVASGRAWLNHYLPADRPRIAGGIWKYVSTEHDTHYHRPNSAFMLRQSPDHVIGFASAADAEEAGYLPGPSIDLRDQQSGRWFENQDGSGNPVVRVGSVQASGGSLSLNLRIPASQIPKDVYVLIRATDILADAIDSTSDFDRMGAIYRMLRRMRQGSQNYIDLSVITGNAEAFADATRWYPILEMLEQGATAKLNRGGIAAVNNALSRQSTQMARNNARMLIPQVKEALTRGFTAQVRQEGQNMLQRNRGGDSVR